MVCGHGFEEGRGKGQVGRKRLSLWQHLERRANGSTVSKLKGIGWKQRFKLTVAVAGESRGRLKRVQICFSKNEEARRCDDRDDDNRLVEKASTVASIGDGGQIESVFTRQLIRHRMNSFLTFYG